MSKVRYRSRYNYSERSGYVKTTEKRSKSGCLTCRRRKKKCDEVKPRCSGCTRNILQCTWPENPKCRKFSESDDKNVFIQITADEIRKEYNPEPVFKAAYLSFKQWKNSVHISKLSDGSLCQLSEKGCKPLKHFPSCEQLEVEGLKRQKLVFNPQEDSRIRKEIARESPDIDIEADNIDSAVDARKLRKQENTNLTTSPTHALPDSLNRGEESIALEQILLERTAPAETMISREFQDQHENAQDLQGLEEYSRMQNSTVSISDENWKSFLDLQLEPYRILKEPSPALPLSTNKNISLTNINIVSSSKSLLTEQERLKEVDFREQPPCSDSGRSNYCFLDDEKNESTVFYRKLFESYDKGVPMDFDNVSNDEAFLLYACIHKFIPGLGPQDTHPMLTTDATFIPQVYNNFIMKEVFLCCGATYLEWYDRERYSQLSNELYESSQALIKKHVHENGFQGVQHWLLASFQLLCLRNKTTYCGTVDDCVDCLSNSYSIIKSTYYVVKPERTNEETIRDESPMVLGLQNLAYEIENNFMGNSSHDKLKDELVLQPHERMYIESFIYNYSVAILFATDISRLPNPFSVFKELSHVLKCPIYYCQFEWMNNPVLGSALDAFEVLAKVSYLARIPMPLDPKSIWYQRAQQVLTMSRFYTSPVLPPQLKASNKKQYESAKLSSLVGKIVTKSCFLLVSKVIHYESFDLADRSIQMIIREIFVALSLIPRENRIWGILPWSLVITGSFATASRDRETVIRYLLDIGENFHLQNTIKIRYFLEKVWLQPKESRLDFLFQREELSKVVA